MARGGGGWEDLSGGILDNNGGTIMADDNGGTILDDTGRY